MAQQVSEFTAIGGSERGTGSFDTRSGWRWVLSHLRRYPVMFAASLLFLVLAWGLFGFGPIMIGRVAAQIIDGSAPSVLLGTVLVLSAVLVGDALASLSSGLCALTLSHRLERDARDELYRNLLGKSQTYHNRQRVGDLVARATDDTRLLSHMVHPGIMFMSDMVLGFISPIAYVVLLDPQLMIVPVAYALTFIVAVRRYVRRLGPVLTDQRQQYGEVNAGLEEAISGIEVVKAAVREVWEHKRFSRSAGRFRDLFVTQGRIEALYVPMLVYGGAVALAFLHGTLLFRAGTIELAELIALVGLMNILRIPTFMSAFSFSIIQGGLAGARRILAVLTASTELDENVGGHSGRMDGALRFEQVSFGYEGQQPVLEGIDLQVEAGETLAIVGQTGAGKTTLTQLVNRTYDPTRGRVLIDGVDLRAWNLTSVRSQVASIEQDVFLFSRTVAENIAFSRPGASQDDIEAAARAAASHQFITGFNDGYQTTIGERGVMLSGGQRQRLALARAFLKDPRILILDDSTSAIDSATEDEIQTALRAVQRGRTTLIITHRLSQIRWADRIVVMAGGRIVAAGSHDDLLARSPDYRRIFSRYDIELPPLVGVPAVDAGAGAGALTEPAGER